MVKQQIKSSLENSIGPMNSMLDTLSGAIYQIDDVEQSKNLQATLNSLYDSSLVFEKLIITIDIDSRIEEPTLIESQLILTNGNINEILVWRALEIATCASTLTIEVNKIKDNSQAREDLTMVRDFLTQLNTNLTALTINIHKDEKAKSQLLAK